MLSMAAVFSHCPSLKPSLATAHVCNPRFLKLSSHFNSGHRALTRKSAVLSATHFSNFSSFRVRSFQPNQDSEVDDAASTDNSLNEGVRLNEELFKGHQDSGKGSSFLAKLAIGLGVAATVTFLSIGFKEQNLGTSLGVEIQRLADVSSSSSLAASSVGFSFKAFGYRVVLPQYAPGWVYFWLLMAAGCGLFISEEALNIWVGITLARKLCLDGTWQSFASSFSSNAPYIISTVLWVYWGVCISDMIPYYLGKLLRQSGASDDLYSKLGVSKEKVLNITQAVQRYGNLSGFVERFSIGVRNPTAFLAGAMGVSPECFFAGVCCGGLITLPVQLAIGFLLRERPLFALATVATVVGIWTIFPYVVAASTALFFYLRQRYSSS
ncbi:hypothetical protein SOVF_153330 [Spinacia oleracea]|uniref:Uncharacterized protein isoform X2 n=1 Tax=Spinacia oleracea TaxID=3562 RepID=A0A9R0K7M3_SPIOL|nr:uncharacterized protein LOC110799673 isoform X2 [Spinacia oleracea]KNA09455.1 hypothetical protein SOVF_153330 [Spinacia oleracea]